MSTPRISGTCRAFTNGPVYKDIPYNEKNLVDFSCFRHLSTKLSSYLSIKYVRSGTEMYNLGGRSYNITQGRYLLTNKHSTGSVTIDSDKDVNGICIAISPALLSEVIGTHHDPSGPYPREDFYDFLTTASFFEHDYKATNTALGQYLQNNLATLTPADLTDQLLLSQVFYSLAANLVADQREIHGYINSFTSVRDSTRKDLLHRMLKGKEFMDDCYTDRISITAIARAATMSEYYFLRLFKQMFRSSPHRYIVERRLQKAHDLLRTTDIPISTIADSCGFNDVHTFSKTFKKRYGFGPAAARQQ
ncbi:MAG: AraC family transcriptional regulator [Bacteroidota bacterium]